MPLQDITYRSNTSPKLTDGTEQKNHAELSKASTTVTTQDVHHRVEQYPKVLGNSFQPHASQNISTVEMAHNPFAVSVSVVDERKSYAFPVSAGCLPCNTNPTNISTNHQIELTPFDDWESMILGQPIRLSTEYLQSTDSDDKRSICLLCRGVSVQAGSEVRHCRGRVHRTAYGLLQTLRFTDASERALLHQNCINKNGQEITAWKCLLCRTKHLSHEYMNKHLLGKKHRHMANMELESGGDWNVVDTAGMMHGGAANYGGWYPSGTFESVAMNHTACFYCQTGQLHHQCLKGNPLQSAIVPEQFHVENEPTLSAVDNTAMRNPDDIVRFLGILSPEKPASQPNHVHSYDTVMRQIDFASMSLSPQAHRLESQASFSDGMDGALQPNCISFSPETTGPLDHSSSLYDYAHSMWPSFHYHGAENTGRAEEQHMGRIW